MTVAADLESGSRLKLREARVESPPLSVLGVNPGVAPPLPIPLLVRRVGTESVSP